MKQNILHKFIEHVRRLLGGKALTFSFCLCLLFTTVPATAQDQTICTATVNGQTVKINSNGSFSIFNIPAGPTRVRVYITCSKNGQILYGRSAMFEMVAGQTYSVDDIPLSTVPLTNTESITAVPDNPMLTAIGQTTQVRVMAKFSDDTQSDVTASAMGTTYRSSTPTVVTINQEGLITARGRGVAVITATNGGATATSRITVKPADPLTTVQGFVHLANGTPVQGANVTILTIGGSAVSGLDGSFTISGVATEQGALSLTAQTTIGGEIFFGAVNNLAPIPAGITDAGIITVRPACDPQFAANIFPLPGPNAVVKALVVFDDGTGSALYAGGEFTTAVNVAANGIAKWDGRVWSPLGSGTNSWVNALAVFDDGTGPALYAGGSFTSAGGVPANRIAKWNGTTWSPLGSGIDNYSVDALTIFDDGSGPALYAGGPFTSAGGVPTSGIARWNGTTWSALGSGISGGVNLTGIYALIAFNDGTGQALYAGGDFTTAGGVSANNIAKWNGTTWSPLSSGANYGVYALTLFNDGTGSALYAAGGFTAAGGVSNVAKWNGTGWSLLGSGFNHGIRALTVFDDGTGPALYAGGGFTTAGGVSANRIAKWNGTTWSPLGSGISEINALINYSGILTLIVFDDGESSALYAGGNIIMAGTVRANNIAKWNGFAWSRLNTGMIGMNDVVRALAVFDDGTGPALYAGGEFSYAGDVPANFSAKWNGTTWSPLGSGTNGVVHAWAVFDDGTGSALYAGGTFTIAGGVLVNRIAKWNGSTWSPLGSGMNFSNPSLTLVFDLVVFNDGMGPALYAGGQFTTAGGTPASRIAKWNGTTWSPLGSGVNSIVRALTVFNDGTGMALYVGGDFTTAGGVPNTRGIAKWNGTAWSPLGSGISGSAAVFDLTVFDDGTGSALYAGGSFTTAGGVPANRIAKWNGTAWSALGSGISGSAAVYALTVFDDGTGSALYAGGSFTTAGGVPANRIAKWNGTTWSPLGSGVTTFPAVSIPVEDLTVFNDGTGPALYIGGHFTIAGGLSSAYLAKWYRPTCP